MRKETQKTIDKLQSLIKDLIRKYEEASYARATYLTELTKVKNDLQNAKNKIAEQEKRLERFELKQALILEETDNKQSRKRVMKIVKEIDKCISMLND